MKALVLALLMLPAASWSRNYVATMMSFYNPQDIHPNSNDLFEAVQGTEDAADLLCIGDQVDTMLCMWHRESHFDRDADDSPLVGQRRRSLGVTQTRADELRRWAKFWHDRDVHLPPFDSVRTQAYYGVAEFYTKLQLSHGGVFEAVRRYNGGGPKARAYARRVMTSRKAIFKRPYKVGERQSTNCE